MKLTVIALAGYLALTLGAYAESASTDPRFRKQGQPDSASDQSSEIDQGYVIVVPPAEPRFASAAASAIICGTMSGLGGTDSRFPRYPALKPGETPQQAAASRSPALAEYAPASRCNARASRLKQHSTGRTRSARALRLGSKEARRCG